LIWLQYFKENPHFTDTVLKKEFKYIAPPSAATEDKPDADGITQSMLEFSWERDVESSVCSCAHSSWRDVTCFLPQATKINWKDADKALTKIYPRTMATEEDEDPVDSGSFFHFFEQKGDWSEVCRVH
jgi:template-activating factor I